ncbi:pyridine nucleotide-disulfide oxidoreductase [Rhodothalassium salexigens DSM 2132]|uniref:Pyridine nucleotide-disulfide oxidoreductase n=1 Tax=Rhodothalassium salexigens DSM 2132 TaxID=1188247 RepID=A0A4R2PGN0_RHOSA|nr:FAD-dependent oxidoreductase [Rhodothalassium salexigens]MBB4211539.1 NADPH-dependent 2,4-dienoyl-CoA reductase/sulfur reductase-like enzyme [Rhodothalassium salexigens DSM 2132]MBK1639846.1 hypothetical protein [Rhodothalassium salexigens DSM 2132]TCP34529.1 pyridine nucleotide-disulfide oxidoreductase [Rhodothalassium salexigens DSM 2132]
MSAPTRRQVAGYLGALAALTAGAAWAPRPSAGRERLVVVGGGPAGAAAALALKRASASVLLVERDPKGLGRAGASAFDRPGGGPGLAALRRAGVEVILDEAVGVHWADQRLALFSGRVLAFDRLFLAPGTAARPEAIPGLDPAARHLWPAAWGSAREARRLSAQLAALPDRPHVILRLPDGLSPRHAVLDRAHHLARRLDRTRPGARLTVLDAATATDDAARWQSLRAAEGGSTAVDWRPAGQGGTVVGVDARRGVVETAAGRLVADAVNFIETQGAGTIARTAGLVDASGWCPTDPHGRSLTHPQAAILGDARKDAARTVAGALRSGLAAAGGALNA